MPVEETTAYAPLLRRIHWATAFSSAGGYSLKYFWTFSWPRLVTDSPQIAHAGELTHDALAWLVYAVVALHIAATAWHAVVMRDGTVARMWPRRGTGAG